jgi:membrane protein DedA with SNARE-associated domain
MVLIGHYLGKSPWADQLHKIILIVILVSVLPVAFTVGKRYVMPWLRKKRQQN